jgi:hypothetical protein
MKRPRAEEIDETHETHSYVEVSSKEHESFEYRYVNSVKYLKDYVSRDTDLEIHEWYLLGEMSSTKLSWTFVYKDKNSIFYSGLKYPCTLPRLDETNFIEYLLENKGIVLIKVRAPHYVHENS